MQPSRLRSVRQTCELLAISKSTLRRRALADPEFPQPHLVGPGRFAYSDDQIAAYQQTLRDRAASAERRRMPDASAAGRASAVVRRAKAQARRAAKENVQ